MSSFKKAAGSHPLFKTSQGNKNYQAETPKVHLTPFASLRILLNSRGREVLRRHSPAVLADSRETVNVDVHENSKVDALGVRTADLPLRLRLLWLGFQHPSPLLHTLGLGEGDEDAADVAEYPQQFPSGTLWRIVAASGRPGGTPAGPTLDRGLRATASDPDGTDALAHGAVAFHEEVVFVDPAPGPELYEDLAAVAAALVHLGGVGSLPDRVGDVGGAGLGIAIESSC